jgi:hypothetical protein
MPEIAGQRPAPASLTRGKINDFHRPGKIGQETELRGWGGRIRTSAWRNQKPSLSTKNQRLGGPDNVYSARKDQRLTRDLSNLVKLPMSAERRRDLIRAFETAKAEGAKPPLKYLQSFRDRHGKPRHYFRRPGSKTVALPGLPGSAEFMEAYAATLGGEPVLRIGPERRKKLYIIRAGKSSLFKIGISRAPGARLGELQVGSASPLELIAALAGSIESERDAHRILTPWRIQGEWFDLEPADIFTNRARRANNADGLLEFLREFSRELSPIRTKPKFKRPVPRLKSWDEWPTDDEIIARL